MRLVVLAGLGTALAVTAVAAQSDQNNTSIDPMHVFVPAPVPDPITTVTERIPGSDLSAEIMFVESRDGVYSPIAMMKPQGRGPFPLIVLAHMNGGQGTRWLREWLRYGN